MDPVCQWTEGCTSLVPSCHWHYQTNRNHPRYNKRCFTCDTCDPYHRLRSGNCGWEESVRPIFASKMAKYVFNLSISQHTRDGQQDSQDGLATQ